MDCLLSITPGRCKSEQHQGGILFIYQCLSNITSIAMYHRRNLARHVRSSFCLLTCFILGCSSTLLLAELISHQLLAGLLLVFLLLGLVQATFLPVFIFVLGFTFTNYQFALHKQVELPNEFEGQSIQVEGIVNGLPDYDKGRIRFRFLISDIREQDADSLRPLIGKHIQLSCYRCQFEVLSNQHWLLSVRLKRPNGYASWGSFDYEKYLFRHQISAVGYVRQKDSNHLLGTGQLSINGWMNAWRWSIKQSLYEINDAGSVGHGVISALTIGDKTVLSKDQKHVFQSTGVSHLMAISGLHIGLVFFVTAFLFKWLLMLVAKIFEVIPRQHLVLIPALLTAFFYACLAGFAVSTQRALIMLTVYSLIRLSGHEASLLKVLLIAAVTVLVIDPFSILEVGFWLSFSAVLVIAIVCGSEQKKISLVKLQPSLWLGMLPLTLLFFGTISLISPIVNLFIVPLFCLVLIPLTLFALVFLQFGWVAISAWIFGYLSKAYETIYLGLEYLSELPIAIINLSPMSWLQWSVFLIFAVSYGFNRKVKLALLVCFACSFSITPTKFNNSQQFEVVLLDVGQGLSMVVQSKDYALIYDTGPSYQSGFNAAEAVLIPYLHHNGIKQIDTVIVSHADNDHIGGYQALSKEFQITQTMTSRVDKLPHAKRCKSGQRWKAGEIYFEILSPDTNTPQGSNNQSCVLKVSNAQFSVLLTGDIEKSVERHLFKQQVNLNADVMLVPHQGSKTSSTTDFIDRIDPKLGLIAAGYRNHYRHPHPSVTERYEAKGVKLMNTVSSGSILMQFDENDWSVSSYRQSQKRFWHRKK